MKREKSCGAVIYRVEQGRRLYLVEHTPSGKTVIPKGHVEGNETEIETALREIREETNLTVALDTSFREVATYSPRKDCIKDVVFFLAQPLSEELIPQPGEVVSFDWLPFDAAYPLITYVPVREVLKKAELYLASCVGTVLS